MIVPESSPKPKAPLPRSLHLRMMKTSCAMRVIVALCLANGSAASSDNIISSLISLKYLWIKRQLPTSP